MSGFPGLLGRLGRVSESALPNIRRASKSFWKGWRGSGKGKGDAGGAFPTVSFTRGAVGGGAASGLSPWAHTFFGMSGQVRQGCLHVRILSREGIIGWDWTGLDEIIG